MRSRRLYIRLARADCARLRFFLEAQGHLATASVVDPRAAVACLRHPAELQDELRAFLHSIQDSVPHTVVYEAA